MKHFKDRHFKQFSDFIYSKYGILYKEEKIDILQSKLNKIIKKHGIQGYNELFTSLKNRHDSELEKEFLDQITIHKTDFFREVNHFNYISQNINNIIEKNPDIKSTGEIRVWSSACSTGEEPYTIAMVLKECIPPDIKIRVLGTDISNMVLETAQKGIYNQYIKNEIGQYYVTKYFIKEGSNYVISEEIKSIVSFRLFNLMEIFPFKNNFHIIFCRNVMIYFDMITQHKLIEKMYNVLNPGGLLVLGHSEPMVNKEVKVKFVQPSIYLKE